MEFRDQPNGLPLGYSLLESRVLVPQSIQAQLLMRATEPAAIENQENEQFLPPAQALVALPRRKRAPKKVRIYSDAEVVRFESGLQALSRNSDCRRASEALLLALKEQEPIGLREFVRVPRDFRRRLDALEVAMPNFRQVIHQIRLLLTLQKAGRGLLSLPPLLLAGDPGVGKTLFATELAKAMGLDCHVLAMENATSGMLLTGLEQFYATASPGKVFDALVKGRHANPLLVVDEIDKASADARHPPVNALYQLLERNTARQFHDLSCLDITLDTSHINWIVTANDPRRIAAPMLSRMTVIHVPWPTRSERLWIAQKVYDDLRRGDRWEQRFEATLPEKSAQMLAGLPGSIRRMQSTLRLAFAYALDRNSRIVEVRDLNEVLLSELPLLDLEDMPPAGRA